MDGTGLPFSQFADALQPECRPIVATYPMDEPLGYPELETLVRASFPANQPFVLMAESFSGPIAVSIAASSPPGLIGVVLSCSFVSNPRPECALFRPIVDYLPVSALPPRLLGRWVLGRFATKPLSDTLARVIGLVSASVIRSRLRSVLEVNVASHLRSINVPLLYLRATEDRVVPAAASKLISQWLPSASVVDVEGPHFLLQAVPSLAAHHVKAFVREVQRGL